MFYGCTEAVPAGWAFTCREGLKRDPVGTHVQEDLQIWELVDPDTFEPVAPGARGLTVVTNLNSEGSPQLRFFGRRLCDFRLRQMRVRPHLRARSRRIQRTRRRHAQHSRAEAVPERDRGSCARIRRARRRVSNRARDRGRDGRFTIVVETSSPVDQTYSGELRARLEAEIIRQCELRPRIQIVAPGTLPRTEFKARRVIDRRHTL